MAAPLSVLPSALPAYPDPPSALARLHAFRAELHACCTRRADALVDLADALLSAPGPVASLPHLSLEPAHRRGWGSTYAALARGRIDAERLRDLLAGYPLGTPARRSTPWMSPPGRAATPSARPSGASTTTPPGTRPASRSWPAGRSSGSASSASPGTPGPPRWTPAGCIPWTTPTSTAAAPDPRAAWRGCPLAGRCHGLCSTPATTPRSCRLGPGRGARGGAGAAARPTAASTPTRHHARPAHGGRPRRHGAKFAFADPATWPAPTATLHCQRRPVRHRDRAGLGGAASQAAAATPATAPAGPGRSCAAPSSASRSSASPPGPARRRCCGCGGPAPASLDLDLAVAGLHPPVRPGAHRPLRQADPRLDHPTAAPSRPGRAVDLAGAGRLHPAAPGPPGRGDQRLPWERPRPPGQLSPYRVRGGFRAFCARSARRPPRRNPPGAPQAAPRAAAPARPAPPGDQEAHQEAPGRSGPRPRRPPDRPNPPSTPADLGRRPPTMPNGLKRKLRAYTCCLRAPICCW